ncbi:MAG: hypothetical protein GAK43_00120 [Stenotrophomonas maltophilia]|nr:MAG: hypothetical protein GAK43_00120 [Stenotrophomonas maltophilia]
MTVQLVAAAQPTVPVLGTLGDADARAPATPAVPVATVRHGGWTVALPAGHVLWRDGSAVAATDGQVQVADDGLQHCLSLTRRDGALESLHSPMLCVGPQQRLAGSQQWQWQWSATRAGQVRVRLQYENPNGPINTGVTAAVKTLVLQCAGEPEQRRTVALPRSVAAQASTSADFSVAPGVCRLQLQEGFNMSALQHFAHYTGGKGGRAGVLNAASVQALLAAPVAAAAEGAR